MRFSIEVDGDDLTYSYKVGASEQQGKEVAHQEHYMLILEMVRQLTQSRQSKSSDLQSEVIATTWINNNQGKTAELLEKFKGSKLTNQQNQSNFKDR